MILHLRKLWKSTISQQVIFFFTIWNLFRTSFHAVLNETFCQPIFLTQHEKSDFTFWNSLKNAINITARKKYFTIWKSFRKSFHAVLNVNVDKGRVLIWGCVHASNKRLTHGLVHEFIILKHTVRLRTRINSQGGSIVRLGEGGLCHHGLTNIPLGVK